MHQDIPQPIFTLRGHRAGVTSLTHLFHSGKSLLVSGDEGGTVIVWDLSTFRRLLDFRDLCGSRLQSLKVLKLSIKDRVCDVLVAQSRSDGVQLYNLTEAINLSATSMKPIVIHPTYDCLFSRGDSVAIKENGAILAYPSSLESSLVTVRYLDPEAETLVSGSAKRPDIDSNSNSSIFDILIKQSSPDSDHLLYVGYEDGKICTYIFNKDSTRTVPGLHCTGLRIDLLRTIDLKFGDFVSAFDVSTINGLVNIVAGSAKKEVVICECVDGHQKMMTIKLPRPGVSAIAIRRDRKLLAIASWFNTVELYSMKSKRHLATLTNHRKQVQCIEYLNKSCLGGSHTKGPPSGDQAADNNLDAFLICCASSEGTISISSIY